MTKRPPQTPEETPFDRFRDLAKKVISAPRPEPTKAKGVGKPKTRKNMRGRGS